MRDVDLVHEICPGLVMRGMEPERITPETKLDDVWGPWQRAMRMHASDPEIRHEGSTASVPAALGLYLLLLRSVLNQADDFVEKVIDFGAPV